MLATTHRLNTTENQLDVVYYRQSSKLQLQEITVTTSNDIQHFQLQNICINGQPANDVKGFKAKIIQDESSIRAEIHKGKLYLFSDSFETFQLKVEYESQDFTFTVSSKLRVSGLQALIEKELCRSDFKIYDKKTGRALAEVYTLGASQVTENTTISIRMNEDPLSKVDEQNIGKDAQEDGLGLSKLPFVNFQDEEGILFDKGAPKYRTVIKGLNLEGVCTNANCEGYNQLVCAHKGIAKFYMHEACVKATCTLCDQKLENVSNCILWDCMYTIEGKQTDSDKVTIFSNKKAPKNNAISFVQATEGGGSNIVNWDYLIITTSEIPSSWCTLF